jgi:PAS domain S-box-containing protein
MAGSSRAYKFKLLTFISIWLVLVLGLAAMVGQRLVASTRHYVLRALDHQSQSTATTLEGAFQYQMLLTKMLAHDPSIHSLAMAPSALHTEDANRILADFTAQHRITICYFMDRSGTVLAASNHKTPYSFVGHNYSFREYFKEAMQGTISMSLHVGVTTGKRGLFVSYPVLVGEELLGVLVTKDELDGLEEKFRASQALIMLVDANGVVLLSSQPQWEGLTIDPISPELRSTLLETRHYGDYQLRWSGIRFFPENPSAHIESQEYFFKAQPLANIDWRLLAFTETYPVTQTQYMAIALGGLLAVAISGTFLWIHQNRRINQKLTQSERLFRTLYESSADAFLLLDPSHGFIDCNDMALRLFGFKNRLSLRNKRPHELSPTFQPNGEDSREAAVRLIAQTMLNGSGRFEWTHRRSEGILIPTEVLLTRVDVDGKPILQVIVRDISDRKRMEDALRRSEERYRTIFENLLDGYFRRDIHGILLFTNEKLADMLGYTTDEMIGKNMVVELCPDSSPMPDLMEAVREGGGRAVDYELKLKRKDGSLMVFSSNIQLFKDQEGNETGLEGVLRDITPRKRMEEELRLAKTQAELESARLASIISVMEEGVVFADAFDHIVEVNDYFCNFVGKRHHEVLHHSIWDIFQGELGERLHGTIKEYQGGERKQPASLDTTLDSSVVTVRTQAIFRGDQYEGVLINLVDITSLVEARIKAELASRTKSEFIANMSHEIRTPMHAIIGLGQVLGEGSLTTEQSECLQMIQTSADHLLNIINAILDFSKIEAGKLELDHVQFALEETMHSVLGASAARIQDKNLRFIRDISPDLPAELVGDPVRLSQILINLLDNAIKFTSKGHISCSIGIEELTSASALLRFSVADTGIGIPHEKLGTVFESFTQVDSSITRRFGGTGLGLAISRHLVESMGGHIWVESEEGKGSCFHFTARFALPETAAMAVDVHLPARAEAGSGITAQDTTTTFPSLHLLLAEDNLVNQRLAARVLGKHGHRVTVVENGLEVLKALELSRFDLILMDIQMPDMDGLEATRLIRQQEAISGCRIPIIALTAHAMKGDRERCFDAGMDDYISKPIKVDELLGAIEKWAIGTVAG